MWNNALNQTNIQIGNSNRGHYAIQHNKGYNFLRWFENYRRMRTEKNQFGVFNILAFGYLNHSGLWHHNIYNSKNKRGEESAKFKCLQKKEHWNE